MSKAGWAAIVTAVALPSIALVVVVSVNARRVPPPSETTPQGPPPPPLGMHRTPDAEEMLLRLRKPLELTDDQVDRIWDVIEPAHRRMLEIEELLHDDEVALRAEIESPDPDEEKVTALLEKRAEHRLEMDELRVLTPIRVRNVLTDEQKEKLEEIWQGGGPPLHPPGPPGPPHALLPNPPTAPPDPGEVTQMGDDASPAAR